MEKKIRAWFYIQITTVNWLKQFWKLYLNLCSCKWLSPTRSLFSLWSSKLKTLYGESQINLKILFLAGSWSANVALNMKKWFDRKRCRILSNNLRPQEQIISEQITSWSNTWSFLFILSSAKKKRNDLLQNTIFI